MLYICKRKQDGMCICFMRLLWNNHKFIFLCHRYKTRLMIAWDFRGDWKVSELKSVRIHDLPFLSKIGKPACIGKCQNWKMSETAKIGRCQKLLL